jgi:hypothetical protein
VDHQVNGPFLPRELRDDGVHEERHVVGHDLDDRVTAGPTLLVDRRREDAHVCGADRAMRGNLLVGQGCSQEILRAPRQQVLGGDVPVVAVQERLERLTAGLIRQLRSGVDDLRTGLLKRRRHG